MMGRPDRLGRMPRDRVLTETDAPARDAVAGRVDDVEMALARVWQCGPEDVRTQIWRNFAALVELTNTGPLMPPGVRIVLGELGQRR